MQFGFSESGGRWERGSTEQGEWTYEGGRKRRRVVPDGESVPVIRTEPYGCTGTERMIFHQFGWYRRILSLVP